MRAFTTGAMKSPFQTLLCFILVIFISHAGAEQKDDSLEVNFLFFCLQIIFKLSFYMFRYTVVRLRFKKTEAIFSNLAIVFAKLYEYKLQLEAERWC